MELPLWVRWGGPIALLLYLLYILKETDRENERGKEYKEINKILADIVIGFKSDTCTVLCERGASLQDYIKSHNVDDPNLGAVISAIREKCDCLNP